MLSTRTRNAELHERYLQKLGLEYTPYPVAITFFVDACTVPKYLVDTIKTCTSYYSWEDEEEGAFHPGWEPMAVSDVDKLPDEHQSPWIWQSALTLNGTPFWGIFASYWGGGKGPNLKVVVIKLHCLHLAN